jgi:hypothetical protein
VFVDGLQDFLHFPPGADVAGVDSHAIDNFCRFQRQAMVEVDIGDQGDGHLRFDLRQRLGGSHVRNGYPDDFASDRFELFDLLDRRGDIACIRRTHRLH